MTECELALERTLFYLTFWRGACVFAGLPGLVLGLLPRFNARPR